MVRHQADAVASRAAFNASESVPLKNSAAPGSMRLALIVRFIGAARRIRELGARLLRRRYAGAQRPEFGQGLDSR
jgi:hypothetical protein